MFLFWLFLALAIGALEKFIDSYDAYKYHNSREFQHFWGKYKRK